MAITRKKPLQCPIEATLAAISARWKARIVWKLAASPLAFHALRDGVAGISDRMLTEQLSQLVHDRIVSLERDAVGQRYQLTALGLSLLPLLQALHDFGEKLIRERPRSDLSKTLESTVPSAGRDTDPRTASIQ